MNLNLTSRDISQLENLRLARVRQQHPQTLGSCFLRLKPQTLVVHCPEPWYVDQLMEDLDHVVKSVWLVLGLRYVSICYAGEEVLRAKTRPMQQRCFST
jgi:hypothetical protein